MSFNILLTHILGKANSDADFLPRMQSDLNLTLQMKLTNHVPVREIDAKAPDVSLSNISEITPLSEAIQPFLDKHLISQMKTLGLYDQFLVKQPSDNPDIHITGFYTFHRFHKSTLLKQTTSRMF